MKHKAWLFYAAVAALLMSLAGCDLALSAKIGNAYEIPDRQAPLSALKPGRLSVS
jgi:hypothetical protein